MPTLAELGEFEVIRRLDAVRARGDAVVLGSGDDAAVLEPEAGRELVVTTDTFAEGRHYLPAWCGPALAGRRLAIANLSDIAAMGARPRWALRSSGVAATREVDDLVAFESGLSDTLAAHAAHVVGGNLTSVTGGSWFSLTLIGDVARGRAWRRSGARAGDVVAVTGSPGRASAGYRLVRKLGDGARDAQWSELIDAWVAPASRLAFARSLADRGGVTAAIDISDGLAADLGHVCEASGVGAEIDMAAWPSDDALHLAAAELGLELQELRVGPGDDYELVLALAEDCIEAVRDAAAQAGVPFAPIGRFTEDAGRIVVRDARGEHVIPAAGYDHFGRQR